MKTKGSEKATKKNPYIDFLHNQEEEKSKKQIRTENYIAALKAAEAENWEKVNEIGLSFPALQDKLIRGIYFNLPDSYKYTLPVMWYLNGGSGAESVCEAVKNALKYRPDNWIGEELANNSGLEIFIAFRGEIDKVRDCIKWKRSYLDAWTEAQMVGGKVYRGYITTDRIIAFDVYHANEIIQYRGVLGVEQLFPRIPINLV